MAMLGVLLLATASCVIGSRVNIEDFSWKRPELPDIFAEEEIVEGRAQFQGHVPRKLRIDCDLECQISRGEQPLSVEEVKMLMSYETLDVERELRIRTVVNVSNIPSEILRGKTRPDEPSSRRRRSVFGYDTRFTLNLNRFADRFPFSAAVRLSTGCGGVLISPKHVLTSAHCIHDGKKYLKGAKKLRVGRYMKKKVRKNRKRKARKARKRSKRSPQFVLKFRWTRAKKIHTPEPWILKSGQTDTGLRVEYDYAVIQLKRPLGQQPMKLGISPEKRNLPGNGRIHFTAFNSNKNPQMKYRYCMVEDQSADMIYNYCDTERGSSGAGIYIRLYDRNSTEWDRRVIGVFSGHQWVESPDGSPPKEYNTAVRITQLKYGQICYWKTGDYNLCRDG